MRMVVALATAAVLAASQIVEGFCRETPSKPRKEPTLQARAVKIARYVLLMGFEAKTNLQFELVLVFGAPLTSWLALVNPIWQSTRRVGSTVTRLESFGRNLAMMKGPRADPRAMLSARRPFLACKVTSCACY